MDASLCQWRTAIDRADQVEMMTLPRRQIVSEEGWPESFWPSVGKRKRLSGAEAEEIVGLFQGLEPGTSARCHKPPWGLAFYEGENLLHTVTLCFECNNAYVYTPRGKVLDGFDSNGPDARKLLAILKKAFPL